MAASMQLSINLLMHISKMGGAYLSFKIEKAKLNNACAHACTWTHNPQDIQVLAQLINAYSKFNPSKAKEFSQSLDHGIVCNNDISYCL